MEEAKKILSKKNCIRIRGANEHNLKNVDVDIPRDALVVFTGLSGSGKSSLAFDTIYACLLYTSGWKPSEECKGRRELDCDTDGWSRYESRT